MRPMPCTTWRDMRAGSGGGSVSPDRVGAAHRRVARDDPQLGAREALSNRGGARPAAGARQGPGNRASRADLKGLRRCRPVNFFRSYVRPRMTHLRPLCYSSV